MFKRIVIAVAMLVPGMAHAQCMVDPGPKGPAATAVPMVGPDFRYKDKTTLVSYGDSITAGFGSTLGNSFPVYAKAQYGFTTLSNYGIGGAASSDVAAQETHLNRSQGNGTVYTVLMGQNDLNQFAGSTDALQVFKDSLREQILWLAIPAAQKWLAFGTPGNTVTFAGTWSNSALYDAAQIKYSTVVGSTATCTSMTAGTAVYVGMLTIYGITSHTYTITIDGVVQGTWETQPSNNFNITTAQGITYAPRAHRFAGLANTTHTAVVTCASGTTSCSPFLWCGTNSVPRSQQPTVVVGNLTAHADGTNTNVLLYKAAAESVVNELVSDGHSVVVVDTYNALNAFTDYQVDNVHPNDSGNQKLGPVFVSGIRRSP